MRPSPVCWEQGTLPPLRLFLPLGCGRPWGRVCLFVTIAPERRYTWVVVPYRCCQPFLGYSSRLLAFLQIVGPAGCWWLRSGLLVFFVS